MTAISLKQETIQHLRFGRIVTLTIPDGVSVDEARQAISLAALEHKLSLRWALYASEQETGYLVWLDDTAVPQGKDGA